MQFSSVASSPCSGPLFADVPACFVLPVTSRIGLTLAQGTGTISIAITANGPYFHNPPPTALPSSPCLHQRRNLYGRGLSHQTPHRLHQSCLPLKPSRVTPSSRQLAQRRCRERERMGREGHRGVPPSHGTSLSSRQLGQRRRRERERVVREHQLPPFGPQ